MIIGQYSSKIGQKRRVAIPSKFRKHLGSQFIATRWYENCLVLVSTGQWEALIKKLIGEARGITEPVRDTDRFLLGLAFKLKVDEQGRVIVPEKLYEYAGFKERVIFLGLGDRIELWDEERWDAREEFITKNAGQFIDELVKKRK